MKSPALFIAFVVCFLFSNKMIAQSRASQAAEPTFAVGLAPFSLLLPSGKANLRAEWAYANRKSLSLLVYAPRPTTVPGFLAKNLDFGGDLTATKSCYTAYGAVLEHRFYLGQNSMHGFYLAPYGRYSHFAVERTTQNSGNQYKTTVTGTMSGFGLGAAAGVQFRLGDFLTLDATLAGVDFKWLRGALAYSTDDPENNLAAFRDKVQETVGGIPIIGSKLAAAVEGNTVKVRTPGLLAPGYRFNLTVNFFF
jgi:hypothetical protein